VINLVAGTLVVHKRKFLEITQSANGIISCRSVCFIITHNFRVSYTRSSHTRLFTQYVFYKYTYIMLNSFFWSFRHKLLLPKDGMERKELSMVQKILGGIIQAVQTSWSTWLESLLELGRKSFSKYSIFRFISVILENGRGDPWSVVRCSMLLDFLSHQQNIF
jgi:hypothetical protein